MMAKLAEDLDFLSFMQAGSLVCLHRGRKPSGAADASGAGHQKTE